MAVSHRGAISFGLVHIPVGLYTATQDNDIHFNQICKEDGSRVKYKKVCANCGKEVRKQVDLFLKMVGPLLQRLYLYRKRKTEQSRSNLPSTV